MALNGSRSKKRSGDARFGYRPSPEVRKLPIDFPHQLGQLDRRRRLDGLNFDHLQKQWRSKRIERGREGWHDFGNKDLPIEKYKHDIMRMVASNRISLLAGETGSGKSTQLAQYALEMGYDRIVYLQPRRVITDNISERIEAELTEQFEAKSLDMPDHLVGMAHSERATLRDDSIIQIMTSGVFKKRASSLVDDWKSEKVLVVADEVHEGNIETEFSIATAAEIMTDQSNWNMVLMSATMNEAEIQNAYAPINGRKVPSITVEGRPHEIEQHNRPAANPVDVFFDECVDEGNKTLIFTDGKRSIGAMSKEIERRMGKRKIKILSLHSKIDNDTRREIFYSEDVPDEHTVIISTSAGQSGLTISGVDRVISDGWTKSPELDAENSSGLPRRLCSRAELTQQMGRGGRDIAGAKFFLTKPFSNSHSRVANDARFYSYDSAKRDDHAPADIYNTVITRNVLSAAGMDKDFYSLNEFLIHKVTYATIKEAYLILQMIGAVDEDNRITQIGKVMDKLPLRPELARAVAEAQTFNQQLLPQVLAIAASIEAGGVLGFETNQAKAKDKMQSISAKDDFLAELDVFIESRRILQSFTKPDQQQALTIKQNQVAIESCWGEDIRNKEITIGELDPIYQDLEAAEDNFRAAGLDSINVLRANKQFDKMCRVVGIDKDVDLLASREVSDVDRNLIHEVLLTGMPHLLYEEVSRQTRRGRQKKNPDGSKQPQKVEVWYRNILAPPKGEVYTLDRQVGRRSILADQVLPRETMIAGYPRWFVDDEDKIHNIIERGFPTSRSVIQRRLGRHALSVRSMTEVGPDGRLHMISAGYIGNIQVSHSKKRDKATSLSRIDRLVAASLESPGSAQRELRHLKKQLEDLAGRVPLSQQTYFFEKPPLSDEDLMAILKKAASGAGSIGELDANIRRRGIKAHHYISEQNRQSIEQNMPRDIDIGGEYYRLQYDGDQAVPIISNFSLKNAHHLPRRLCIRDGREVKFKVYYVDEEARLLTAEEIIELSQIK